VVALAAHDLTKSVHETLSGETEADQQFIFGHAAVRQPTDGEAEQFAVAAVDQPSTSHGGRARIAFAVCRALRWHLFPLHPIRVVRVTGERV
jgi:hypothetical protein